MTEKSNYVKVPVSAVIFVSLLLVVSSTLATYAMLKIKNSTPNAKLASANTADTTFSTNKTNKPLFQFFVMSFCPYGNQAEDAIKPVADLLGDKVDFKPQYIFEKLTDLTATCKAQTPDPANCADYLKSPNVPFKTVDECKAYIGNMSKKCLDESQYIKASNGSYYASLHGRQEANQDVREICAWNQTSDKKQWWNFIDNVNKNCTAQNADSCWEEQAKKAGLDTNKITECFNKDAIDLIEKEIASTTEKKVQGSPTLFLNGTAFPPESAFTQDGKGTLKVGTKVFTQSQFRTAEFVKQGVCAAFNKAPNECKTELDAGTASAGNAAAAQGGCATQ